MDNEKLFQEYKSGDTQALEQILLNNRKYIFRYAYKILKNTEDAKDVTQDVMIKLMNGIHNYKQNCKLETYIFEIVKNACEDFRKKNKTLNLNPESESIIELMRCESRTSEDIVIEHFSINELIEKIKTLPNQQLTLIIHMYNGYSYEEIAALEDIPIGTIRSRLNRARKKLKAL